MEVAAAVPEQGVRQLKAGMAMEVSLWTKGSQRFPASLRELALSADPATRTYPIRVHVSNPPADMKLGMSASVIVPSGDLAAVFRIPLTAIVQRQGVAGVWMFDADTGTVKFKVVKIVGVADNDALVGEGIDSGERIVTAGAMLLHEGQQVKLMAADQPAG
jgi:RND family efflux transporter MFP subunit